MENVTVEEIENQPNPLAAHSIRRPVSEALGTGDFGMNSTAVSCNLIHEPVGSPNGSTGPPASPRSSPAFP